MFSNLLWLVLKSTQGYHTDTSGFRMSDDLWQWLSVLIRQRSHYWPDIKGSWLFVQGSFFLIAMFILISYIILYVLMFSYRKTLKSGQINIDGPSAEKTRCWAHTGSVDILKTEGWKHVPSTNFWLLFWLLILSLSLSLIFILISLLLLLLLSLLCYCYCYCYCYYCFWYYHYHCNSYYE